MSYTRINIYIRNCNTPHIMGAYINKPFLLIDYFDVQKFAKNIYGKNVIISHWEESKGNEDIIPLKDILK